MKNNDYITSGIIKGEFKMSEYLKDSFSAQTELNLNMSGHYLVMVFV